MGADERLKDLASALSGGEEVDWDQATDDSASEEELRLVANLQLVDQVKRAARTDWSDDGDQTTDLSSTPDSRAAGLDPGDTPTLTAWGHLNLLEKMGKGGFGEVYRAWDTRLNRPVALKLLHAEGLDESHLLEEAQMLAKVEHANLTRIYGVERHEDRVGIWMELVEGVDLRSLVREGGPLSPVDAAAALRDVCQALEAIHGAGVLHRDIKPQNIMRSGDGRVVLMDLGAGRKRRIEDGENASMVTGTPRYMAPEILLERAPASPRTETYSLGVTLFYLLSGALPADGNLQELFVAHRDRKYRSLEECAEGVPAELRAIVRRCLAREPSERFAAASELGAALDAWVSTQQRPRRRRRMAAAVVATGLALLLATLWIRTGEQGGSAVLSGEVQLSALADDGWAPLGINDAIGQEDEVQLTVQLSRSAHVYILNRDAEGNTVVLFPMEGGGPKNPLPAGRPVVLPGIIDGQRKGWAFSAIEGPEDFLVVASAKPLEEFEGELSRYAAVDIGGGLNVTPLSGASNIELALAQDMRGVIGMVDTEEAPPKGDVFAMAESFADQGERALWMQRLRLRNTGR